jgi:ubiquinone/menaquinone biosynthesis C-methylase UbiE
MTGCSGSDGLGDSWNLWRTRGERARAVGVFGQLDGQPPPRGSPSQVYTLSSDPSLPAYLLGSSGPCATLGPRLSSSKSIMGLGYIQRTFDRLGRVDPLWAVLSSRGKRHNRWDPVEFFQRGSDEVAEVMDYLRTLRPDLGHTRVLDFGCGVGRLSQALADHFDEVVGVDISEEMLERAREFDRCEGRVRYIVNQAPDLALLEDESFDLVYSNITLQHIPPRYGRRYIGEFFRVLRAGGVALFQMRNGPVIHPGTLRSSLYRLNREPVRHLLQRLAGKPPYEIHFMARSVVEEVVAEAGGRMVDVVDVGSASRPGKSLRYCAVAR